MIFSYCWLVAGEGEGTKKTEIMNISRYTIVRGVFLERILFRAIELTTECMGVFS